MVFVESALFTRLVELYLVDEEYQALQRHLMIHPGAGSVIKGSGGVRKVRWGSGGRGKSGGLRVIYYWKAAAERIFLLTLYAKSERDDLGSSDLRKIKKLVQELGDA